MPTSYPILSPHPFGTAYDVPRGIRVLPFDLFRSALITRNPNLMAQNIAAYQEAMASPGWTPAQIMPQRLYFQQHKASPYDGVSRAGRRSAISSVMDLLTALEPSPTVRVVTALRAPVSYDTMAALDARGANQLPQVDLTPMQAALVRARPAEQPLLPPPAALLEADAQYRQITAAQRSTTAMQAMQAASAAQSFHRRFLGF